MALESGGLLQSVRTLLATLVGIARNRLELLVTELEEERLRLTQLVFYGLMALFFFALGVVLLSLWVVVAFWDTHRMLAISAVLFVHMSLAVYCFVAARRVLNSKPRFFSATLGELAKDQAALRNE